MGSQGSEGSAKGENQIQWWAVWGTRCARGGDDCSAKMKVQSVEIFKKVGRTCQCQELSAVQGCQPPMPASFLAMTKAGQKRPKRKCSPFVPLDFITPKIYGSKTGFA